MSHLDAAAGAPLDPATGWTEPRVDRLRALWLQGLSAAVIARTLGGVTRNAVIGKVHRLGLSGRATPAVPRRHAAPTRLPSAPSLPRDRPRRPAAAPSPTAPLSYATEPQACVPASEMRVGRCAWPIGDPRLPGFGFCGAPTTTAPYCAACARRAYRPRPDREQGGAWARSA